MSGNSNHPSQPQPQQQRPQEEEEKEGVSESEQPSVENENDSSITREPPQQQTLPTGQQQMEANGETQQPPEQHPSPLLEQPHRQLNQYQGQQPQQQQYQQQQNVIEQHQQQCQQQQNVIEQQQQAPQGTVLVVQQPIILGRGAYIRRGQPFMYRGVQLGNGRKIGMNCMITLGIFGAMLMFWGIIHGINTLHGFICVFLGAVQIGSCFRLCQKAKQDFDSLPQDHPDRVTYSSPIVLSREAREIASNTTTYQLPPGAQIISSSALQAGQMPPTYQLPAGAQVISSTSTVDGRLAPPGFLQQTLAASSGSRASPFEDKPPPYEEVVKHLRH